MNMSIDEFKTLIQQEKESEEKIRKAKEEADNIIKEAQEKAEKLLEKAENPKQYDEIFQNGLTDINGKKKLIEEETEKKIQRIHTKAKKNLDKTTALIVNHVLEE